MLIVILQDYVKLRGATSSGPVRYQLAVSDGMKINRDTVLSTDLNYLFENGTFKKHAVFKVLNYKVKSTDREKYLFPYTF